MSSIYGSEAGPVRVGGIKAGYQRNPETGRSYQETFREAIDILARRGVDLVVLGCTEISMSTEESLVSQPPLIDPMDVAAREAVRVSEGSRPLPSL
jgi:aspartate/glutamate racemase